MVTRYVIMKLLIIVELLFSSTQCNSVFKTKTLQIDRLVPRCSGYKNLTFYFEEISFNHIRDYLSVYCKIKVTEDVSSSLKQKVLINRCKSREALDSCELYPEIIIPNLCMIINSNLPPYKHMLDGIVPKLKCPIKKGIYVLTNGTVDDKSLSIFPLDGWYLKMQHFLYDKIDGDYKTIGCFNTEGKLIAV